MLQEDPVLFQLYKDLVVSQVISADEFWANRLKLNSADHSVSNNSKQEVGISAAFLVSTSTQRRASWCVNAVPVVLFRMGPELCNWGIS